MVRLDYWGSFFTNDIQTLTWDNPIRATDFNNGLAPPSGPYDPSGYSNGNGPALGQAALWPSNNLNSVGATGMYKIAPRTTINGNLKLHLHAAERVAAAVDAQLLDQQRPRAGRVPGPAQPAAVVGRGGRQQHQRLVNLNSRALNFVTIQARYRYNDHDNNTPHFDGREYVRFDAVPEEFVDDPATPYLEGFSEYFQITRQNFDVNGTFGLRDFGSLRLGYANEQYEREGRGFSDVSENTFRAGLRCAPVRLRRHPRLVGHGAAAG